MASYLRPRRGTASAASAIVLKKGEIFCEFKNNPATTSGGTSCGAIKMGNGTTSYQSLGYFLNPDTDVVTWAATTADGQPADWGTYGGNTASSTNQGADLYSDLNALVTGSQNKKVLPLIKNLLYKLATQVTKLNNDYDKIGTYGYTTQGTPFTPSYPGIYEIAIISNVSDVCDYAVYVGSTEHRVRIKTNPGDVLRLSVYVPANTKVLYQANSNCRAVLYSYFCRLL